MFPVYQQPPTELELPILLQNQTVAASLAQ
jgi:hypothetical protein